MCDVTTMATVFGECSGRKQLQTEVRWKKSIIRAYCCERTAVGYNRVHILHLVAEKLSSHTCRSLVTRI